MGIQPARRAGALEEAPGPETLENNNTWHQLNVAGKRKLCCGNTFTGLACFIFPLKISDDKFGPVIFLILPTSGRNTDAQGRH